MRSHTIGKNVVTNSSYRQSLKKFLQHLGAAVGVGCIPIVVFDAVGCPVSIVGSSMEPTLSGKDSRWWKRDIVWVSRFGLQKLQVGRVYAFVPPDDPHGHHIKRLVAQEGDVIRPKNGSFNLQIPNRTCWMESDNPIATKDSNTYGPVNYGLITGRATHIIWPPQRWQVLEPKLLETHSQRQKPFTNSLIENFRKFFDDSDGDNRD
ncbi:unnamed protein product [Enterobius vermicularis]|uniref:Mitochondrial inner membrane protease subunit 2 n=1 Tax=Enterobius vermicularis TaxID=51028 RepID=A0A0N4VA25_ENTVE|nr:unnamed protein product [Enterobius vermicularis]